MSTPFGPVVDAAGLRAIAAILDRPIHAVDVGCRDGVRSQWRALGPYGSLVGFDTDAEECARLNAGAIAEEEHYEPIALAASGGQATLYLTADPQSASLYPPNEEAVRRHPELWRHEPRGTTTVATTTLDAWAEREQGKPIDVLKEDVQGAELDVLRGAEVSLRSVRALELEVEFESLYVGQPLFGDVDNFLRERGFSLWRLRDVTHCGLTKSRRDEASFIAGSRVETTRVGGQIAWANAVYVRSELGDPGVHQDWETSARDACVAAMFDLPELVELALERAVAGAPSEPRRTLAAQLTLARRRANRRRLHGLFWDAPRHARGFVGARLRRGNVIPNDR
ncbi:MAG: FkbM family methyltransferase [Solirubrobacteraceae bacterium]|jgi:FkbM family methyltransferase